VTSPARRPVTGTARTGSPRPGAARPAAAGARIPRSGVVRAGAARGPFARPNLWLVPDDEPGRPQRSAARTRRAPFVVLLVVLLVGTTIGLLVLNTAIAVDSLKATQLRTENAQRVQDVQRLQRQVVDGSTSAKLAAGAAAASMVPAGPPAYLVIEGDGSSAVRGTPAPAQAPASPTGGN
jgi:hypothetical protein